MSRIIQLLGQVAASNGLDKITAERALITAPFGCTFFDECVRRFSASRAIQKLSAENKALILIVTSKKTKVRPVAGARVIQIDPIPDWPQQDRYQSRFVKWGIPYLFPRIRQSLYVDSDLHITDSAEKLLRLFEEIGRHDCVMTKHETRRGWEDEYDQIIEKKRCINIRTLEEQRRVYRSEGLPADIPIFQTNFIGRVHGSRFDALSAEVLTQMSRYSERDQLALPSAMRLSGLNPHGAEEGEFLYSAFKDRINRDAVCFVDGVVAGQFFLSRGRKEVSDAKKPGLLERALNKLFLIAGSPRF
ncbi:MAG TPA: glycosyltransferase domain-containing protein [Candidatus Omnitrophota bacterium]|nr:glycosyltransferase domain-containing protein [Candidatus Omnitrophota bacterium]